MPPRLPDDRAPDAGRPQGAACRAPSGARGISLLPRVSCLDPQGLSHCGHEHGRATPLGDIARHQPQFEKTEAANRGDLVMTVTLCLEATDLAAQDRTERNVALAVETPQLGLPDRREIG